jgi:hypothetical protein
MDRPKIASVIFLLLLWLLTSGCCFLLSDAIVTALCHPAIQGG